MRISADENDPDFWANTFDRDVRVSVDGQAIRHVTEADDQAGYVICEKIDEAGQLVLEGDQIATFRMQGAVEIVGTRRAAHL